MLNGNLMMIAILGLILTLTGSSFGQNTIAKKAKHIKSKTSAKTKRNTPKSSWTDWNGLDPIVRRKTKNTTSRKRPIKPVRNLELDNGGLDTTDEAPEFGDNQRTRVMNKKPRSKGFSLDGKGTDVNVERVKSPRKRKTTLRKKPKNTHNLLPYIEQSSIYRKGRRNK